MNITSVRIRRAVKVNLGNYENTDIIMELESPVTATDNIQVIAAELTAEINTYLRNAVDEIELGKRKSESKAKRFGL